MTTPVPEALPTAYEYGRVIGRFLRAVGDGEDVDVVPEAVPATGTVTFTPIVTSRILIDASAEPSPLITHEPITCELDAYGHIARNGLRGVWLWTGEWTVSFNVSGMSRAPFPILVSTAHTDIAPLDLWEAAPYTPPAGATVTTMMVPSNPTDGYTLVWSDASGGLVWAPALGSIDTEGVQDVVGAMVVTAGGVYDDAAGTITLPANPVGETSTRPALALLTAGLANAALAPCPIAFIGSSTTGRGVYPSKLLIRLQRKWPNGGTETALGSAATPYTTPGVHGYNLGVSGGAAGTYANSSVVAAIAAIQPRAVLHGIGANDYSYSSPPAHYKAQVLAAIDRIDTAVTKPVLHVLMHQHRRVGTFAYQWAEYGQVLAEIAALAPATRIAVDVSGYFAHLGVPAPDWFNLLGDGVHLSTAGYELIAELMFSALTEYTIPSRAPVATPPATPTGDVTNPVWTATMTTGTPTATSVVVAASALATDDTAVSGYEASIDGGTTWASIVPSGLNFTLTDLTQSTVYPAPQFRAKDTAGNASTPALSGQGFATPTPDTTPPTVGTLTPSAITQTGFTLTVSGATDAGGLAAAPYGFTTDNGTSWSAYQTSPIYTVSGLTAGTGYTCNWRVIDTSGNIGTGTAKTVTTTASSDVTAPTWTATFTLGTPAETTITATASALAADNTAVTGYDVSYNGGTTWASITPAGSVFTLTGTADTTYTTTQLRARDSAGNTSTPVLSVPSYTMAAAWSPASIAGLNLWLKGSDLTGAEGDSIASWTDSSGLGNHATQVAAFPKPTVTELGGHRAAKFNSTLKQFLGSAASASTPTRTIFVAFRMPNNTATCALVSSSNQVADQAAGIDVISNRRLTATGVAVMSGTLLPENTWVVGGSYYDQPSGASMAWVNTTNTAIGSANNIPAANQTIRVGMRQTITGPFGGEIAEMLNFDVALADADRIAVRDYLRTKYGTA